MADPDPAAVREHVGGYDFADHVPVRWLFGAAESAVHWESVTSLRPCVEDLAAWERERADALRQAVA